METVTLNRQLTFVEQLQRLINQALDVLGVKPNSSLFIRNLNGEILTYKHFLTRTKEEEFINSFKGSNPAIGYFFGERVQMPNDLYSAKAAGIEQELWGKGLPDVSPNLYSRNTIETYIYNTQLERKQLLSKGMNSIEEIQLAAVQLDGFALLSIENPSEKVQMAAVEKELGNITLLDSPSDAVQIYVAERDPLSVSLYPSSEAARMVAIQKAPAVIMHIENPSLALCKIAIEKEFSCVVNYAGPEATKRLFEKLRDIEERHSEEKLIAHHADNYKQGVSEAESADWRRDNERQKALEIFKRESLLAGKLSTEETEILNCMQCSDSLPYKEEKLPSKFNFSVEMKEHEKLLENHEKGDDNDGELYNNESKVRIKAGYVLEENGFLTKGTTIHELIEEGWKPELLNALARLSVENNDNNDNGENVLKLHFIRKDLSSNLEQPFMSHYFSEEQKRNLISTQNAGETIQITDTKGKFQSALVSVDKLADELVYLPIEKVVISNTFRGVQLTDEDKLVLKTGQSLTIDNVRAGQNTVYSVTVQYSADLKKVVALADSNKITIIEGAKLSRKESEELRKGKTIQVSNMIDDKGEKYSAFVRIGYPKEEIFITPTNEHKVQVSHNNRGEKTEENKKAEKSRGRSSEKSGTTQVKRDKKIIK